MSTPFRINVEPKNSGLLGLTQGNEEAAKVSELLQRDLENHHVFFNAQGYHDHLVHHLLTLYGAGASAKDLQAAFDANKSYQLKAMKPRDEVVDKLATDWDTAKENLGKGRQYPSFLKFFQNEIERLGWKEVLLEYLFKGDDRGLDMQSRLFSGLLHPMIQLLYGLEWEQPALIAAGLAQAAVHNNELHDFITRSKAATASNSDPAPMGTILGFYEVVAKNEKLKASARWDDNNRIFDGVLSRSPDEMIEVASRVRVRSDELEEKTAEMIHTAAYVAAAAAFHPPNVPTFDFFFTHHATSAPFFLTLNKLSWIPIAVKTSLLETKIRFDILQYVARGCPRLNRDALVNYMPRDWPALASRQEDLLPKMRTIVDDGHTIKLSRALILAQHASQPYAGAPWMHMPDNDAWVRAQHMLLDANGHAAAHWVRAAGFEEAWADIPKQRQVHV